MAVTSFHEAALVLEGALQAVDRLLAETEPLERAYHRETVALGDAGDVGTEAGDERSEQSGYGRFYLAVMRLAEVQQRVDKIYFEEAHQGVGL